MTASPPPVTPPPPVHSRLVWAIKINNNSYQPTLLGHIFLSSFFIVMVLLATGRLGAWLDEKKDTVWFTPPSPVADEIVQSSAKNVVDQQYKTQGLKMSQDLQKIQGGLDALAKKSGQDTSSQELTEIKVLFVNFIKKYEKNYYIWNIRLTA